MEKIKELKTICEPLIDFLHKNYDPHTTIIVSEDYIKIVRDEIGIPVEVED